MYFSTELLETKNGNFGRLTKFWTTIDGISVARLSITVVIFVIIRVETWAKALVAWNISRFE